MKARSVSGLLLPPLGNHRASVTSPSVPGSMLKGESVSPRRRRSDDAMIFSR
jgi:hypothetical protein